MQKHNIWDIPAFPGYQGHASGHRRPWSQDVPEAPRQTARQNSPERQRGALAGMGSPAGTYRSPLRPFAPLRVQGLLIPQGCKAAAVRRLPQHGKSSSTRIRTETMEIPTTSTPNGHHLPPISTPVEEAPHRTGAHPHHSHASKARVTGSASHGPPLGSRRSVQLIRNLPPRVGAGPLRGGQHATDTRPREPAADQRSAQGVGGQPSQHTPPPASERNDAGTGHPTNWACTPRDSPPQQQHGQTAEAQRTHRNNGSTTQAAQERTLK